MALLAAIPSPSSGVLHLGPVPLHVYGILLAAGVVVASMMTERRWKRWGHDAREWQDVVVVIVICGVVGARLYHVATDSQLFENNWIRVVEIWKGGLSIWGVVIGGMIGVLVMCRRRHLDTLTLMDAIVPGLLAAQAIGRWGNWFNQELFGEPTKLPWGLEIDPRNRPLGYKSFTTFHPTFLYESLYCVLLLVVLLRVERRFQLRRGQLAALYVSSYTFGRFWFENLRIDNAKIVVGLRVNAWVSALAFVAGLVCFWWLGRHSTVDPSRNVARSQARQSGAESS